MLAIILMLMTSAGFIVYVVITNNRLDDITRQISELKAAASNAMQRQGVSPHSVLQRQDALPALPAKKTATVSTERPAWASVPTPRWVQFETPLDEAELRLDRDSGVMSAEHAGHKIECNFGGAAPELATEQIEVEFVRNAESGEEYAIVRVLRPAFRGRKCVIEWMET